MFARQVTNVVKCVSVRRMGSQVLPKDLRAVPESTGNMGVVPATPAYKRIMDEQRLFCANDGRLVWQKKPTDGYLMSAALACMAIGLSLWAYSIFDLAFLKKKK